MVSSNVVITGSYNYGLAALSVLISISASCAALDLGGRITAARGWVRSGWLVGGATSLGVGIWSMHFTGMLAFHLPVPVVYHWPTVLLSLLAAILASLVVLFVATREKMGLVKALAGSVIMAAGIAGMHFIGMAAMRLSATCHYSLPMVGFSLVIAVLASLGALVFTFDFREETRGTTWAIVTSAAGMGVAISAMHYTGMASASFMASAMPPDLSHTMSISSLSVTGIVLGTLMVQGTAVLTSSVDRRFAIQVFLTQSNDQYEQQSRALIDAIPQQIWSGPADGSLDFCNERWRSYMGLGLEELQGEGWQSMLHPDDRERVLRAWHESVTNGTHYEQEERHRRADGQYHWFLARGVPLRDADGRIVRWYGTNTDIEDLKREEDARRQIEEQHRIVVETATDAVLSIEKDSQILFVNPATTRIFGYESSEIIGQPLTILMPEFLRELHKAGLQGYVATGQRHMNWLGTELVGLRKNGEEFPVEVSFGEVKKEGRHIFTGFIRDIAERKRADAAIRQERDRAQRYLDIADVILLALDLEGRITLINRKGCSTLGWEERELLERDWIDTCHPARTREELRATFHNVIGGNLSYIENPVLTKSGEERMIGWRNSLLRDDKGRVTGTLSSGEDITEHKRAEEELRRLSGQLLRLQDEERRRMARDLHDSTGQNLVALATTLSQLHASIPSSGRKLRKLVSQSQGLADQCVREVRTLSYLLHPPMLDEAGLEDAIRHYADGFAERTGIEVALEISPRFGRMTPDVEVALFRVVQESLTNVQRHSGSLQAKIQLDRSKDEVKLKISDKGRGAPTRELKGNAFLPFKLGVGIPSMHERVKLIGGRLDIETSGSGTTVCVAIHVDD